MTWASASQRAYIVYGTELSTRQQRPDRTLQLSDGCNAA
jgi:hypothetical protein